MALTGTSTNQLRVKLKDVVGRLTEAENRQMLRGPKGSKGELGIKGLQVRLVFQKMRSRNLNLYYFNIKN